MQQTIGESWMILKLWMHWIYLAGWWLKVPVVVILIECTIKANGMLIMFTHFNQHVCSTVEYITIMGTMIPLCSSRIHHMIYALGKCLTHIKSTPEMMTWKVFFVFGKTHLMPQQINHTQPFPRDFSWQLVSSRTNKNHRKMACR